MNCNGCDSTRLCYVQAKCSDLSNIHIGDKELDGYVPDDLGIGGGDYVDFGFCLDCGMIRGKFPKDQTELEAGESDIVKTPIEIIEDVADEIGGTVRSTYSGRGMYGKTCYGIDCDDITSCIELAAAKGLKGAKTDNMGKGYIVYWPSVNGD